MKPTRRSLPARSALLAALLLAPGVAGCDGDAGDAPPAPAAVDTTNESAMDGLSREQIMERAQGIPPERAEEMGIIDSTIHIPDPTLGEDVLPPAPGPAMQPLPR